MSSGHGRTGAPAYRGTEQRGTGAPAYGGTDIVLRALLLCVCCVGASVRPSSAQQVADTAFVPAIARPAYAAGSGPLVLLDEAHHNFHTVAGRYAPFVRLLRRDGFPVEPSRVPLTAAALRAARVLVIANALPDTSEWVLPTRPAFTLEEVRAVEAWVRGGGSLFLIADHMPFAGAAETLAAAFGIVFYNGFAMRSSVEDRPLTFRRSDASLGAHVITEGRGPSERVDSVQTFTGQGFRALGPVRALLTFDSTVTVFLPVRAREFTAQTPRVAAVGLLQGAAFRHGRGRVAVFGEAAMFSAQVAGPQSIPMGMNAPAAAQNPIFLLNVMHWLAGLLEPDPVPAVPR